MILQVIEVILQIKDAISLAGSSSLDIANKLEELLIDETKRKDQIRNAYGFVKSLTWEKSTQKLDSIIRTENGKLIIHVILNYLFNSIID